MTVTVSFMAGVGADLTNCASQPVVATRHAREYHRGNILIAFHNRGEYLHTLSAGLLAVDDEGNILAANRAARALLHGLPASPGRRFVDVFRSKRNHLNSSAHGLLWREQRHCVM